MQRIKRCRVCYGKKLKSVFNLGKICISDFIKVGQKDTPKLALELVECQTCTLVQLAHNPPKEVLYQKHYWYRSGINEVIKRDLKEIAYRAIKEVKAKQGDVFLDIGANDGTLLSYVPKRFKRVGCEPAKNLLNDLRKHAEVVIPSFWKAKKGLKAKIITAIGMFYDMEDPNQFIADVKKTLTDDGVFIAQMMTLKPMLEMNDIGNICHEHIEYYTYLSLVTLFERNGLEIYKVEENKINGGSYRLFARHFKQKSVSLEEDLPTMETFKERVEDNRREVREFIKKVTRKGKVVCGYGASTKANTVLQYYGLQPILSMADRNPEKWGLLTVGTHIPIESEKFARQLADYFLIMPFGFTDAFKKRESTWRKSGGKFITWAPKFSVV